MFFDIGVKAISGIGAILAGLFVYVKWQDEKTRSLFEKSLQEVYAPLINELIKQEENGYIVECENKKELLKRTNQYFNLNQNEKEKIQIEASKSVKFKIARALKEAVNK